MAKERYTKINHLPYLKTNCLQKLLRNQKYTILPKRRESVGKENISFTTGTRTPNDAWPKHTEVTICH